jgi:hypothetical protein
VTRKTVVRLLFMRGNRGGTSVAGSRTFSALPCTRTSHLLVLSPLRIVVANATTPGCAVTRSSEPGPALKSTDSQSREQLTGKTIGRAPRDSAKCPSFASPSKVRQRSGLRGVGVTSSTAVSCIAVRLRAIGRMVAEVNQARAGPKGPKAQPEGPKARD